MTIQEIAERNYRASIRRGKVNAKHTVSDQIVQIQSEVDELWQSNSIVHRKYPADIKELADVVLSCHTLALMQGWDLLKAMEEKALYNETRED